MSSQKPEGPRYNPDGLMARIGDLEAGSVVAIYLRDGENDHHQKVKIVREIATPQKGNPTIEVMLSNGYNFIRSKRMRFGSGTAVRVLKQK